MAVREGSEDDAGEDCPVEAGGAGEEENGGSRVGLEEEEKEDEEGEGSEVVIKSMGWGSPKGIDMVSTTSGMVVIEKSVAARFRGERGGFGGAMLLSWTLPRTRASSGFPAESVLGEGRGGLLGLAGGSWVLSGFSRGSSSSRGRSAYWESLRSKGGCCCSERPSEEDEFCRGGAGWSSAEQESLRGGRVWETRHFLGSVSDRLWMEAVSYTHLRAHET